MAEQQVVWITGRSRRRCVVYSTDAGNLAATGVEAVVLGPEDLKDEIIADLNRLKALYDKGDEGF
jgi:hypothetical protein